MTNPLYNEVFTVAIAVAKRCSDREISLDDDQFPASGTDFSLDNDFKTADRQL